MSSCLGCYVAGLLLAAVLLVKLLRKLMAVGPLDLKKRYHRAGDWAVVTGASEGIGRAFAIELARRGFNVIIIARSKDKLAEVKEQCLGLGVNCEAMTFDFSTSSNVDYEPLLSALGRFEVSILVNNVGVAYEIPTYFDRPPLAEDLRMLTVNVEAQVRMTKFFLPKFKEKRCGAIISLSSLASIMEPALLAMYSGTKAFNKTFSNALRAECAGTGVDILAVTPGAVITAMSGATRESFGTVTAASLASQSLDQLGLVGQFCGHWQHAVSEVLIEVLGFFLPSPVIRNFITRTMIKVAAAMEAKKARLASKKEKAQ
jgi:17beta-estradiol 17-dehydrogenase / very-long-chain 3-oxoacyl-CoA reductase